MTIGIRRLRAWALGVLAVAAVGLAGATETNPLDAAIEAYRAAQDAPSREERLAGFQRAERWFAEAIARAGDPGAPLYVNLGNSALRAERPGAAILAYRHALGIDPDHEVALRNLAHARALLPAWVPKPEGHDLLDTFLFWQRLLSRQEKSALAAFCFALAGLAGGLFLARGTGGARAISIALVFAWAGLGGSALFAESPDDAVIVTDGTIGRAADSRNAPARFPEPLPAGVEVTIREERDSWTRIRLADGNEAWVPAAAVARIAATSPDPAG